MTFRSKWLGGQTAQFPQDLHRLIHDLGEGQVPDADHDLAAVGIHRQQYLLGPALAHGHRHSRGDLPHEGIRHQNTDDIIPSIFKYLPYGPQFYDEDTITDQPMRQIVAEIIREKALYALNEEIPHGIAVVIDQMKDRPNGKIVDIDATIICERDSHKGIIIGKQGAMLKKIGSNARYELEQMLEQKVNLKLWVKVKKDWRDSDFLVKNFGYDKKKLEL